MPSCLSWGLCYQPAAAISHQVLRERESGVYLRLQVAPRPLHLVVQRGGLGQPGHDQQTEQDGHHCSQRNYKSQIFIYWIFT